MKPLRSVLIANRGEIAVRVMRSAKERGMRTIAVYSDADEGAMHVRAADEAVRIGPAASAESYLKIEAVIEACKARGADCVHPGYGFLSENAAFAEALAKEGIIFVGPSAAAIAAMGDKAESKRRMIAAGVPTIPGYQDEDQSDASLIAAAKEIGFPVMVKASAGGGGRGQRIVSSADELLEAIASARREAASSFGDDRLIIEKAVVGARHVEVQVMGDAHGTVVHFGERDCTLQRRRQKVIEEAPSPVISSEMRERIGAAAVAAAEAVDYTGAGTVEFLFDPASEEFYFLEMNTRLQVEHPVTEIVAGVDLVDLQFEVAEGKPLPIAQEDLKLFGWAVEARLYAEDPAAGFLPQTGEIVRLDYPFDPDVRVDGGVAAGDEVTANYDPMIAKVIAEGATRDEARLRLAAFLDEMTLFGVTTNASFLSTLLRDETFAKGEADTTYIERHLDTLAPAAPDLTALEAALAAAATLDRSHDELTGWSSRRGVGFPFHLQCGEQVTNATVRCDGDRAAARIGEEVAEVTVISFEDGQLRYGANARLASADATVDGDAIYLKVAGRVRSLLDVTYAPADAGGAGGDEVRAPMAGVVVSVDAAPGDAVEKGQTLAIIEAMKMEHRLTAPRDGVVEEVRAAAGDQVAIRASLVILKPEEA